MTMIGDFEWKLVGHKILRENPTFLKEAFMWNYFEYFGDFSDILSRNICIIGTFEAWYHFPRYVCPWNQRFIPLCLLLKEELLLSFLGVKTDTHYYWAWRVFELEQYRWYHHTSETVRAMPGWSKSLDSWALSALDLRDPIIGGVPQQRFMQLQMAKRNQGNEK